MSYAINFKIMQIGTREAQEKRERRQKKAAKIKEAIDAEGIEYVLTDILDDHIAARIRFG